jgi:hypothetical protein
MHLSRKDKQSKYEGRIVKYHVVKHSYTLWQ